MSSESTSPVPHQPEGEKKSRARKMLDTGLQLYFDRKNFEKNLAHSKEKPVPEEVLAAYEEHKDAIENIFGSERVSDDNLYHGTGNLKYAGSKYEGEMSNGHRHTLDEILSTGIKPHLDPWIVTQDTVISTSLATPWHYAKWFADRNQDPANPLLWNYGDSANWFGRFMIDTFFDESKKFVGSGKILETALRRAAAYLKSRTKDPYIEQAVVLNKLQK